MKFPRLFGRPLAPAPPWDGSPEHTPIHAWLDAAGFPWRATRAELAARYGVTADPAYGWDVIFVPTEPPLLPGLIGPLSAQTFGQVSQATPATRFSSVAWFEHDAKANLRRTAEALEPHLGGVKRQEEGDTLVCRWGFGPSWLTLRIWPPDLRGYYERGRNEAHERDPRLESGCHVDLYTGWRARLSDVEAGWIEGLQVVDDLENLGVRTVEEIRASAASESELQYARLLPEHGERLIGRLGVSADGAALIFCTRQLYVVPVADVVGLRLEKMSPGRGGGGEWLQLVCRDGPDGTQAVQLASGSFNKGLEGFGERLAVKLGQPYEVVDQGPDI